MGGSWQQQARMAGCGSMSLGAASSPSRWDHSVGWDSWGDRSHHGELLGRACCQSSSFSSYRRVVAPREAVGHAWSGCAEVISSSCPALTGEGGHAPPLGMVPEDKAFLSAHHGDTLGSAIAPAHPHSRSERKILLYRAQALPDGPLSVLGLDVAPSTLLPFYDEDTSVVFLTGKVRWSLPVSRGLPHTGHHGVGSSCPHSSPHPTVPG